MTIRQVITLAQTGELNNIAVKNDISAIVGHINLAMIELYKRFPLNVQEHMIELRDDTTIYNMPDDYMWMVSAYGEVEDGTNNDTKVVVLPINEEDNPLSINTIGFNQVQVPLATDGAYISTVYVAAPPMYVYDSVGDSFDKYVWNPTTKTTEVVDAVQLDLPVQMLEALLHYIGYRAHSAMDANVQAENSTHYTRFEASCNRLEQRGMITSDDLSMRDRIASGGFK